VDLPDVIIENRAVGKVIFMDNGSPVVVCGQGLLKILKLTEDGAEYNVLPLSRFRTRIGGYPFSLSKL
jgi:methionyl-tRNA formyltransferase